MTLLRTTEKDDLLHGFWTAFYMHVDDWQGYPLVLPTVSAFKVETFSQISAFNTSLVYRSCKHGTVGNAGLNLLMNNMHVCIYIFGLIPQPCHSSFSIPLRRHNHHIIFMQPVSLIYKWRIVPQLAVCVKMDFYR